MLHRANRRNPMARYPQSARTSDGGVVSVQSDISEQVACQERLGNEQSILQSAIAAMPSGISVKDPRGPLHDLQLKNRRAVRPARRHDPRERPVRRRGPLSGGAGRSRRRHRRGAGETRIDILPTLDIKVYEKTLATGRTLELRRYRKPSSKRNRRRVRRPASSPI